MGADLEGAAAGAVLKWARNLAKREVLTARTPPAEDTVAKALRANYSKAPDSARQSGELLVWYLAYREGSRSQEIAAQRVRDIERSMRFLNDDLRNLDNVPIPLTQLPAAHEEENRIRTRLRDAESLRDMNQRVLDGIRARVDLIIERLAAHSETMKDRDPADIRLLK